MATSAWKQKIDTFGPLSTNQLRTSSHPNENGTIEALTNNAMHEKQTIADKHRSFHAWFHLLSHHMEVGLQWGCSNPGIRASPTWAACVSSGEANGRAKEVPGGSRGWYSPTTALNTPLAIHYSTAHSTGPPGLTYLTSLFTHAIYSIRLSVTKIP